MRHLRIASVPLVLCAAVLVPIFGCGTVANTKAPQPIDSNPSSTTAPVAPSGLQLGYLWQTDSHNLYPVLGVSGSARFGSGILAAGTATAGAAQTPSLSWVLALKSDGTLQELQLPSETSSALAAHVPLDSTLVFSPSGACAALASASAQSVVVVSGLPLKPLIATLSLPAGLLSGIAVSDAGTILAGVKQAGSPGTQLTIVSETHSPTLLGSIQAWGGAAFVPSSITASSNETAVFADASTAHVSIVANVSGASPSVSALSDGGLLQAPKGLAISPDGRWVYVSDSGKQQVVRLSTSGSASATSVPCACTPQLMYPLTTDGIFALTSSVSGHPNWILDTRTAQPRTFFVPALPTSTAAQSGAQTAAVRAGGTR